jgi:hypothetical protein
MRELLRRSPLDWIEIEHRVQPCNGIVRPAGNRPAQESEGRGGIRRTGSANRCHDFSKVAAPDNAATHDPTDGAQTIAASSTARPPEPSAPSPTHEGDGSQVETKPEKEVAAAGAGRILRGVTMRSGPQNNAVAMTTIPAKTAVQLVSCKQWCQIVYNGKRGWVYKTFVKPDA